MKRPITNLVLGWMALFLAVSQLNAQTTFTVDPQNVTGNPGDQFTVDITASGFTNILSFQYSMTWNPAAIQFVAPVGVPGNLNGLSAASSFGTNNAGNGILTVSWLDPDVAGVSLPNGTVLYSLTFQILTTTGTNIAFGSTPTVIEVTNGNGNPVTFNGQDGMVNGGGSSGGGGGGGGGSGGGGGGGNPGDLIITASNETGAAGSNICVDFSVQNFDDILSVQYSMHFNPAVLSFTGVSGLNLNGLVSSQFGTNNAANGLITLSWLDPDVSGVTVPDGTVIYQLCFDIIGSSGQSSSITINGTPTVIEVTNGSGNPVGLTVNSGSVNVSGGTPPPPPPVVGFAILASDQTVQNGDNFCIEFSVQDFDDILSMQYTMEYDATQIQFTGIQGLNLNGLNNSSFNAANAGFITFSWLDPDVTGVTIPDGTVIYEICFTAIGANNCNNSNQLIFTGSQASIEIVDGNGDEVDFNSSPAVTTICDGNGGGGGPTTLTFTASSETALPGQQLCVDISVDKFDCIVSAQYSMHFNPAILEYTTINNFGLPGMTLSGNFGLQAVNNGTINFSWLDPNTTGVTLPDGSVIYTVCFNVIGSIGQTSPFTFDGNPTTVEVTDCNPGSISPTFVAGTETVGSSCPGPVNITGAIVNDIACFGSATGSIDLSVSGGNNVYTYNWSNGFTGQDPTGLGAGTYDVTVTSCNGAETATASYTITQPNSGINITGVTTPISCFGEVTGAIDLTVTGGTINLPSCNLTYAWSNGLAPIPDQTGLSAGTYVVTVTDCNSCQETASFTIVGPPSELSPSAVPTDATCAGACDGRIVASATGGIGPYEYMLNSGPFGNNSTFENLCAGSYLLKVRDALGCVRSVSIVVDQPSTLTATATVTDALNGNDGSIDLTVTGGTTPYQYLWSNGATTQDISNLVPDEYCVTVTDAHQCTTSICRTVQAPLEISGINVIPSCFGQCTGQLEVIYTGGTPPHSFQWSNPSLPNSAITPKTLCPGLYSVTVTSSDGQTATIQGTVNGAGSPVMVSVANLDLLSAPGLCDGSITLGVGGGFGGYSYAWTGPTITTSNPATNLCAGNYTVTVSDQYGCTGVLPASNSPIVMIFDPEELVITEAEDKILCVSDTVGGNGAILNVSVTGGIAPYTFTFNGAFPAITGNSTGTISINDVPPGTYTVNISDSAPNPFNQTKQAIIEVRLIDIDINPIVIRPVTNGSNGAIDITVSGGDPIYTFQWNAGPMVNSQDQTGLEPGTYDVFIQDLNGCVEEFTGIEVKEFLPNPDEVRPNCPSDLDGSITLNPTGSNNMPLNYLWNTGATTATISNLPIGNYTVTITDAIGASIVETFTLLPISNLSMTVASSGMILCNGDETGGAIANPLNGMPPYNYQWSANANSATTKNISGVAADTYSVTVIDAAGCEVDRTIELDQPDSIIISVIASNSGDCTEGNGTATANVSGGEAPYTYRWNDPLQQSAKKAVLLQPGGYRVTVTDVNGCEAVGNGVVNEITPLIVEGLSVPDTGGSSGSNGQAIANVVSGTPPYEYTWRDYVADSILTELLPGTYYVAVQDSNNCEELVSIIVDDGTICLEASAVITPEGDGYNEEFKMGCLSRYSDNRLEIFNRWGQLVYLADNYNNGNLWRGTNRRGGDVPDGVYYYVFEYVDPVTGTEQTIKGAVTVLRK
jgi:gliding motility-associated-like protein